MKTIAFLILEVLRLRVFLTLWAVVAFLYLLGLAFRMFRFRD